jgi:hypothetical protein
MNTYYILTEAMTFECIGQFPEWDNAAEFVNEEDIRLDRNTLWIFSREFAIELYENMKEVLGQ